MPNYRRYYLQYDYVFITVVTYNRQYILLKNINLFKQSLKRAIDRYGFEIFAIVILEDHFHIILHLNEYRNYSNIIGSIKKYFSHSLEAQIAATPSRIKRKEKTIWQRRFYDHIIRDAEDLHKHMDYIHYNPIKHNYVSRAKDWQYSSFYKFVKLKFYDVDWCDFRNIRDLEFE